MLKGFLLAVMPMSLVVAAFVACGSDSLDLGANEGTLDAAAGEALDAGASFQLAANETWKGYIENFVPSPDDALTLTLTSAADGGLAGSLVFGTMPLYPPPTDPNIGYPALTDGGDERNQVNDLEGFSYTLRDATTVGSHLHAIIDTSEFYAAWCALQTPMPVNLNGDGGSIIYGCLLPPTSAPFDGGAAEPGCWVQPDAGPAYSVNCNKYALCEYVSTCSCTATSCTNWSDPSGSPLVSLDLQIDGAQANGGLTFSFSGGTYNVYLTQQ